MNTPYLSRKEAFLKFFPDAPNFRWKQIGASLFQPELDGWHQITSLPKNIREMLQAIPWISLQEKQILQSKKEDTYKAILLTDSKNLFETVLMKNRSGSWTICVSSQVGCAMGCTFCATGKLGLRQNLHYDHIIDQYRFWRRFLEKHPKLPQRISNVVFMGMGEPLANYENVKKAIQIWLKHTDLGPTHITVSTVGVLPILERLLNDREWPHVRLAISLHSADAKTRKAIVPTSMENFLPKIQIWAKNYLKQYGNRRHHLTFEYVMLRGVNDTAQHAMLLKNFVQSIGNVKVNLIPYNFIDNAPFQKSTKKEVQKFSQILENNGVTTTIRRTMGEDIAAACGQLITSGITSLKVPE